MQHSVLDDLARKRLRVAVRAVLAGSVLALAGIFGFGAFTGAGDYFGSDAEREAAIDDHYWQIWGLLLPVAIAIVISGVAIWLFTGSLAQVLAGRRAVIVAWIRRVIVPLAVVASVPYWFGPELDDSAFPTWAEAIALICLLLANASIVTLGAVMLVRPLPRWIGIAVILGGILAVATFLPLFVFVGLFVASIGLLRWSGSPSPAAPVLDSAATL
jgi:hypothetical protein